MGKMSISNGDVDVDGSWQLSAELTAKVDWLGLTVSGRRNTVCRKLHYFTSRDEECFYQVLNVFFIFLVFNALTFKKILQRFLQLCLLLLYEINDMI